jgi:hypothetical protein
MPNCSQQAGPKEVGLSDNQPEKGVDPDKGSADLRPLSLAWYKIQPQQVDALAAGLSAAGLPAAGLLAVGRPAAGLSGRSAAGLSVAGLSAAGLLAAAEKEASGTNGLQKKAVKRKLGYLRAVAPGKGSGGTSVMVQLGVEKGVAEIAALGLEKEVAEIVTVSLQKAGELPRLMGGGMGSD